MGVTEVWQIFFLQLIFILYIGANLILYWRHSKPIFYVIFASFFSAFAYLVMIYGYHVTWWGLQGDEVFIAANLEKMSGGHFFSDFFYKNFPPFYPPLYFWLIGAIAYIFDFSGVTAVHVGVFLVFLFTPIIVYLFQKYYFINSSDNKLSPWQMALVACLILIVADKTAIILKPYEYISSILVVLWTIFLLKDLQLAPFNLKKRLFFIISGAILFLTFYFWFFIVALATVIYRFFSKTKLIVYYKELLIIGISILGASLPYILPLIFSYLKYGVENWQSGFLIMTDFNLYLPFFTFSIYGLLALIGITSLVVYFKEDLIKGLVSILVACYLWQLINALTMIFFNATFLPSKPFLFLAGSVLMIASAYGLAKFWEKIKLPRLWQFLIFTLALITFARQLLFGDFIFDPEVQRQLVVLKNYPKPEIAHLENKIKVIENLDQMVILSGGVPELSGYINLNYYLSYNIHFSHPAAQFSQRYNFVKTLCQSKTGLEFYNLIKSAPLEKIDALLLYKGQGDYQFIFWVDNFPDGAKEEVIWLKANLLDPNYFEVLYEDKFFILFGVK